MSSELSVEHVHAIGALVVTTSRLESVILDLTSIFSQTDILATIIMMGHQQISGKIDSLKALYARGSTEEELKGDKILAMLDQAKDLGEFRNTVVHAIWSVNGDTSYAVRFQARGRFKSSRKPISAPEIQRKEAEARELYGILRALRDRLLENNPHPAP